MALLINADTYKTLALTKSRVRKIGIPMLIACSLQLSVYLQTVMNLKFSKNSFLANPVERENCNLEFTDEFEKNKIDTKNWLVYYFPHWSSREVSNQTI